MVEAELKVKLSAQDDLSPAMKKALDNVQGLNTGAINLSAGLAIAEKAFQLLESGVGALVNILEKSIEEANAAEKAQNQLVGSLISTGNYSAATAKEIDEYTEALERNTGASSDSAKKMIAMGVQMGQTVEQAKKMEEAARKLAIATGTDAETAFTKLQASLNGNARGLAMVIPQVKEFSAAQLKSGEAIDLVNKKLQAQYDQYLNSLGAQYEKGKSAIDDMYKSLGQLILQNPAVNGAFKAIVDQLQQLSQWVSNNKELIRTWVTDGVFFMIAAIGTLNSTFDVLYRGAVAVFNGISIVLEATVSAILKPVELLGEILSKLPGQAGESFQSITDSVKLMRETLGDSMTDSFGKASDAVNNQTEASKTFETILLKVNDAAAQATASQKDYSAATESAAIAQSEQNKALVNAQDAYKNTKAAADALKGLGAGGEQSGAELEVANEQKKQDELNSLYVTGVLNQQEYERAKFESAAKAAEASFTAASAYEQSRANMLGESEEGFEAKKALSEERFQMELQTKIERAEIELMTEEEIFTVKKEAQLAHDEEIQAMQDAHLTAIADRENLSGETLAATREMYFRRQEQAQAASMKQLMSGAQAMVQFQSAAQQTTAKIGNAMIQNQGMTANAMVGMFLEALGTQVQQKGFADMIMGIFPPNPVQLAAGAGEVALGTVIGRLGVSMQKKNKGGAMAHDGIDEIPQSMDNKSFTLAAGERVIQPEANKDLKDYLSAQKGGSGKGGSTVVNVTINGDISKDQARKSVDMVIEELRRASERGAPIINEKGIIYNS